MLLIEVFVNPTLRPRGARVALPLNITNDGTTEGAQEKVIHP